VLFERSYRIGNACFRQTCCGHQSSLLSAWRLSGRIVRSEATAGVWGAECSISRRLVTPEDRTSISGSVFSSERVLLLGHGVSRGSPTRILGVHEPVAVLLADLCDADDLVAELTAASVADTIRQFC